MDTPTPQSDPQLERRQLVLGIVIILLLILLATGAIFLLIVNSGGRGNYMQDVLDAGEQRQGS
jgi:hypothetical protein